MLGDALWRSHFNADPRVLGRTIRLNRRSYTVIGVAPPPFAGTITGLRFDLYVPLTMQATLTGSTQWLGSRSARPLYLFARMKPGVSIEQARAEVASIAAALEQEFPRTNRPPPRCCRPRRRGAVDLRALLRILLAPARSCC